MVKKSQSSNDTNTDTDDVWVHCPECGVRLKQKNLNRHLTSKHSDLSPVERKRSLGTALTEYPKDTNQKDRSERTNKRQHSRFYEELKAYAILGVIIAAILIKASQKGISPPRLSFRTRVEKIGKATAKMNHGIATSTASRCSSLD